MQDGGAARQRLFIALPCPLTSPIASALAELRALQSNPAAGLRVVADDTLHITLGFPGAVPAERIADVHDALAQLRGMPAPQLAIVGAGCFPNALWLGVAARAGDPDGATRAPLGDLAQRCEEALRARGFPLDGRPFHPHVTLARLRDDARFDCAAWCRKHHDTAWAEFTAGVVHLYRSETLDGGARYSVIHSIALG